MPKARALKIADAINTLEVGHSMVSNNTQLSAIWYLGLLNQAEARLELIDLGIPTFLPYGLDGIEALRAECERLRGRWLAVCARDRVAS